MRVKDYLNGTDGESHLVWTLVSQMMRTCSRLSPSAPRYCICQHALWSTHLPSGSCEDNEASIGMETSAFSMYFHRRYSARLIIWPLPPLYMNTPNWSRINSSTAYCPPTLKASIKSPPVVWNWEILIKFSSRRLYCRKWILPGAMKGHVWWNVCFRNVNQEEAVWRHKSLAAMKNCHGKLPPPGPRRFVRITTSKYGNAWPFWCRTLFRIRLTWKMSSNNVFTGKYELLRPVNLYSSVHLKIFTFRCSSLLDLPTRTPQVNCVIKYSPNL